jgi:hypothetical protein
MAQKSDNKADGTLLLDQQQISYLVAAFLMVGFFIFIAGYYWGKKQALEPITEQFATDSLTDKIYCALCEEHGKREEDGEEQDKEKKNVHRRYYAQLAGFGSLKGAQVCIAKLADAGFEARVVERESKSAHGKVRKWYQVVSSFYDHEEELKKSIGKIQHYVNVRTIAIRTDTAQENVT